MEFPNSKIPALIDYGAVKPVRIFESGAILLYLAEKFGRFIPLAVVGRMECISWLLWQVGSAPYLGEGLRISSLWADQVGVRDRPIHNGGEAAASRSRPAPRRTSIHSRKRLFGCRYR